MWMSSKCIRHIVRLSQMLKRWSKKVSSSSTGRYVPSDVPPGYVAVCVGSGCRRFIVRATHLNHPVFRNLLRKAEAEYGFDYNEGPLSVPCDESDFEEALQVVTRSDERCLCFTASRNR